MAGTTDTAGTAGTADTAGAVARACVRERQAPARRRRVDWAGWGLLTPALALLLFVFAGPLLLFLKFSFYTFREGRLFAEYTAGAYRQFLGDAYYHGVVWQTARMAALTMAFTVLTGYPIAYAMWKVRVPAIRAALGLLVFMPLTVTTVVRSYGWQILLGEGGMVNYLVRHLHLAHSPISLIYNLTGVVIALVQIFLPFAVFPIYASLARIDPDLKDAADDLGASWRRTFARVTFPLSLPGVVAGAEITLTLALGAFVTPSMLGGGRVSVLPLSIYNDTTSINWPLAAVEGLALLILAVLAVWLFRYVVRRTSGGS